MEVIGQYALMFVVWGGYILGAALTLSYLSQPGVLPKWKFLDIEIVVAVVLWPLLWLVVLINVVLRIFQR